MEINNYPGKFIAFEGLDGAGSSTQCALLVEHLNSIGIRAFAAKEPTNNIIGGLIRGVLTHEWDIPADGLQLLYAADRSHHLKRYVIPTISAGDIIVTDRYLFSSIAFGSLNLSPEWLKNIYSNFLLPDITYFIDTSPKVCIKRIMSSRNNIELFEEEEKLNCAYDQYKDLAADPKNNFRIINGEQSVEEISDKVLLETLKIIGPNTNSFKKEAKRW